MAVVVGGVEGVAEGVTTAAGAATAAAVDGADADLVAVENVVPRSNRFFC